MTYTQSRYQHPQKKTSKPSFHLADVEQLTCMENDMHNLPTQTQQSGEGNVEMLYISSRPADASNYSLHLDCVWAHVFIIVLNQVVACWEPHKLLCKMVKKTVAHFSVAFLFYVRNYCTKKAGIFIDKTPGYVTKKTYKQNHHDS